MYYHQINSLIELISFQMKGYGVRQKAGWFLGLFSGCLWGCWPGCLWDCPHRDSSDRVTDSFLDYLLVCWPGYLSDYLSVWVLLHNTSFYASCSGARTLSLGTSLSF